MAKGRFRMRALLFLWAAFASAVAGWQLRKGYSFREYICTQPDQRSSKRTRSEKLFKQWKWHHSPAGTSSGIGAAWTVICSSDVKLAPGPPSNGAGCLVNFPLHERVLPGMKMQLHNIIITCTGRGIRLYTDHAVKHLQWQNKHAISHWFTCVRSSRSMAEWGSRTWALS